MVKIVMHKDDEVLKYECDKRGIATNIVSIERKDLLPFYSDEDSCKISLQMWLLERSIGKTRKDIEPLIAFYGVEYFRTKNYASLFDCYWVKNDESECWDDVNPFKNWNCEDDCYFNLIHDPLSVVSLSKSSPNLTLPGVNRRFWYVKDGKLGIITESSQEDMAIAKACAKLGISSVASPRDYVIIMGTIYSFHPVETSEEIEKIPFSMLYDSVAAPGASKVENLKACCEKYGLNNWQSFFKGVMAIDSEVGNRERGLPDIGVLRDTKTLEVLGFEKI